MSTATALAPEVVSPAETAPPPEQPKGIKVSDLKAGAFTGAKDLFSNSATAIEILNFIEFLGQNNSMSVDDLEIPYKPGEKTEWKLTRAEATKLFFGYQEAKATDIKSKIIVPNLDAQKAIGVAMKSRLANSLESIKNTVKDNMRQAGDYDRAALDYLTRARKAQEQLEDMTNFDPAKRIQDVIEQLQFTNWNFHKFHSNCLEFVSRSDVMLRHIEPKAGINYELNCGKYLARINLSSMTMSMLRYERNAPTTCVPHPHVKSDGHICFGNAADAYNKAVVAGDIVALLKILDAMLPNYNPASPYTSIENFKIALQERDRLEKEAYGKKNKTGEDVAITDQDILDDEPEFHDDIEWIADTTSSEPDGSEDDDE